MNYKRLYKSIIENSKNQKRIKDETHYFESHHIIPDFMFKNRKRNRKSGHLEGNPDDKANLVLLTPREHFLCHILLYKIYKGSRYEYQMGSALQFFFVKVMGKHRRSENIFLKNSKWYEHCRLIGLQSISSARKGKMPAVNAITKETVGSVSINHPRVLSGEWVHHSKGRVLTEEERKGKAANGIRNRNYSGKTDEDILNFAKSYFDIRGYFDKKEFEILCLENSIPTMRGKGNFRFAEFGGGFPGLISMMKTLYNEIPMLRTDYKKYKEMKDKFNAENNKN